MSRYFYRCADCLSVCATETELKPFQHKESRYAMQVGKCGACEGWLEYMGRTQRARLVLDSTRCPCDDRCTSARGPDCECQCGGENHGSHMVVAFTIDQGGIPVAHITPDALARAVEYRTLYDAAKDAIEQRYGAWFRLKQERYLNAAEFIEYLDGARLSRELSKARTLRTHAARNRKLLKLAECIRSVVAA